ncbi:MAG: SH3 domain-containing protein, partial [Omnitrophica WOR_2 bacterium]
MVTTNFSPVNNGFEFINSFELHIPIKYPMPFGGSIDLSSVVFGLCGGMCFAALDYYNAGVPRPADSDVKTIDPRLFTYLCGRQLDSLSIPVLLKVIQWMLLDDKTIALNMARYEVPKLRKLLDSGQPAVLALIRVQGLDNPAQNHQVLAVGYDYDENTRDLTVYLYEPNYPCAEPNIRLNLSSPSAGLNLLQSTGETLHGFFVIPYAPVKTVPVLPAPAAAAPAPVAPPSAAAIPRAAPLSMAPEGLMAAATVAPRDLVQPAAAPPAAILLSWPVDSRRVNQYFGENPASYRAFGLPGHEGLDLFAVSGANVYAAADGAVYEADHPGNHPYGLQIRINHQAGAQAFHTVYAHLSKTCVAPGQQVRAGDLIGQADNTGNSFGSHLHLTLKIDGKQTPGYPPGIVDPLPYLKAGQVTPPAPLPQPSGVKAYTTGEVNLRAEPDTGADILAILPSGESLDILGDSSTEAGKIGQHNQWLQVQTASGKTGYVAAWFTQGAQTAFPPSDLVVYPYDSVNLRSGPGTGFNLLETMTVQDPLTVLGNADLARGKIGTQNQWLQVQTENGVKGFVAAWLVRKTGGTAPSTGLTVYPMEWVNLRARSSTDANILTTVTASDALAVLGD